MLRPRWRVRSCRSVSFLLRSYAPTAAVSPNCGYAEPVCQPTPWGAGSFAMMAKRRVHRLEFGDDAFLDAGKHGHARGIRHRLSGALGVPDAGEVLVQRPVQRQMHALADHQFVAGAVNGDAWLNGDRGVVGDRNAQA